MKSKFSKKWLGSVQPRKQRKYQAEAPLHLKHAMMRSHLSSELKTKYNKRSIAIRNGDKVKVLRGDSKGKEGKIEFVSLKKGIVHVTGINYMKKDGTKAFYPIKPSNILITDLNLTDKKRKAKFEVSKSDTKENKVTK